MPRSGSGAQSAPERRRISPSTWQETTEETHSLFEERSWSLVTSSPMVSGVQVANLFAELSLHISRFASAQIILHRRLNCFFGEHRAMALVRGQATERGRYLLVRKLPCFFHGASLDQFGRHARRGDGGAAAKGAKPRFDDSSIAHLNADAHYIATGHCADFAHAIRLGQVAD